MTRHRVTAVLATAFLIAMPVAGCHRQPEDAAAVTAEEQAQLNDAADTLDANGVGLNDADQDPSDGNTEDPS